MNYIYLFIIYIYKLFKYKYIIIILINLWILINIVWNYNNLFKDKKIIKNIIILVYRWEIEFIDKMKINWNWKKMKRF
jgi:hypothetical protein